MGVNNYNQHTSNSKLVFAWPRTIKAKLQQTSIEIPIEVVALKKKLSACDATGNEKQHGRFFKALGLAKSVVPPVNLPKKYCVRGAKSIVVAGKNVPFTRNMTRTARRVAMKGLCSIWENRT